MKKAILTLGLVALFAASTFAISGGPGGYVYWSIADDAAHPGNWTCMMLYQMQVDGGWGSVTAVNFDNVAFYGRGYISWTRSQARHGLEVLDPRENGGTGSVIQPSINNLVPYDATNYNQPWDIVKVDPSGPTQSLLCDGKKTPGWETLTLGVAVPAPKDWVGTSNNVSLLAADGLWGNEFMALYDANNNGVIDNVTSEGSDIQDPAGEWQDIEIGGDKAIYWTNSTGKKVQRTWLDATGSGHTDAFYTCGATQLMNANTDGFGVAVGPVASNPIVYVIGTDNVLIDPPSTFERKAAIFALQDLNNDNDAEDAGEIVKIWRNHMPLPTFTINLADHSDGLYGGEDLEFWQNPDNGEMFLVFNSYYANEGLFVLQLADNGLAVVDGDRIATGVVPNGYKAGFELDMNPIEAPIPEPGTLLLIGTGILGALGYVRRRRMR